MGSYVWRGVTSKYRYEFIQAAIPAALLDVNGQPLLIGTYNGETLIDTNHDGSVALAVATGPPYGASAIPTPYGLNDNDIYSAYTLKGLWEQQVTATATGPTRVQSFGAGSTGTTASAAATVTAGNLLIAFPTARGTAVNIGIKDTLGNDWAVIPGSSHYFPLFLAVVGGSGSMSDTVTATLLTNGAQDIALTVLEVAGADISTPVDAMVYAAFAGGMATVTTDTPNFPNDLAISVIYGGTAPNTPVFTPALGSQTNEITRSGTSSFHAFVAVSDGPITSLALQTVSATATIGYTIQCLLIQGHS
jgi:hypothetical protein